MKNQLLLVCLLFPSIWLAGQPKVIEVQSPGKSVKEAPMLSGLFIYLMRSGIFAYPLY